MNSVKQAIHTAMLATLAGLADIALAQGVLPAPGWIGGGTDSVQSSRSSACSAGAAKLSAAMSANITPTGNVRTATKGNAYYCEYQVSSEGRVRTMWGP